MKRVLLPTDFSDNAYNAINYAVQLYKNEECNFYLLHTYTPIAYNVGMMTDSYSALQMEEITRKNAITALEQIEDKIKKEFKNPKHTFTHIASFNLLVSEIKEVVEEYNIDLIIMGTQGATGAKEIFLGTHTMYTIKKVKCPIIAVPSGFHYESPKEILFATDYKFSKTNKHIKLIKNICDNHVSRLNILNVYYGIPLEEKQKMVKTFLDEYFNENAHLFHIAEGMDIPEAVATFQIKNKINFLIMMHNKHSFFENLLFKPVINEIAFHTNIPFLVIPSED